MNKFLKGDGMAKILIQYLKLKDFAQRERNIENKVANIRNRLKSVYKALDSDILSASGISRTLSRLVSELESEAAVFQSHSAYLDNTSVLYKECEDYITGIKTGGDKAPAGGAPDSPYKVDWVSKVVDVLDVMGGAAGVAAVLARPFANWLDKGILNWSDKNGWGRGIDILKALNGGIISAADWMKSSANLKRLSRMNPKMARDVAIKRLFGLDDAFAGAARRSTKPGFAGWSYKFKYDFGDKLIEEAESFTKSGFKSALKWGGVALSFASNAFQNYDEYKSGKISSSRAVEETISETAIDVGKDILIGVGVAAAMAATVGSAPVLAVAATTVVVGVGLDMAFTAATGKSTTEFISDSLLDARDKAANTLSSISKKTARTFSDMFNKAANCFKNPIKPATPFWARGLGLI